MTPKRTILQFLEDIRDEAARGQRFVADLTFAQFLADERTIYAVVRALEIIGEATKHIPRDVRAQAADIPWREMAQMRDKLIHDYFGVDTNVVWNTATQMLPALKVQMEEFLVTLEGTDL